MAFKAPKARAGLNAVRYISHRDDAIDLAASDVEAYERTLDESHLKLVDGREPTVFVLNFKLSADDAAKIKNALMRGKDDKGQPSVAYGDWSLEVVRRTLKDIQQPAGLAADERLTFKRDARGLVTDETLAELEHIGLCQELFALYLKTNSEDAVKGNAKNS